VEQELISKKELLEVTGISYGQLYRWKRERLLPEDWFIKKSSYTGQETYFPRKKALDRIRVILDLKDSRSLEELAELFSNPVHARFTFDNLRELAEQQSGLLDALGDEPQEFSFGETVFILALDERVKAGLDAKGAAALVRASSVPARNWAGDSIGSTIFSTKKSEGLHVVFHHASTPPLFDENIEVLDSLALGEASARIKQFSVQQERRDLS